MYCDAHFHFSDCLEKNCYDNSNDILACSCFLSPDEWINLYNQNFWKGVCAVGVHPENPDLSILKLLEKIFEEKKIQIHAIGECGFDFYNPAQKLNLKIQEELFIFQIELAHKFNLPVIIHSRKSIEMLFKFSAEMKKLPGVLFHSFSGTVSEAKSFLNKGINGYFSFGKQIFNGNKKSIQCVKEIPLENLLLETDAPFQTLRDEEKTFSSEIKKIYDGTFLIRKENLENEKMSFEDFSEQLEKNFKNLFAV